MKPAIQNLYVGFRASGMAKSCAEYLHDIKLIPAISAESDPVRLIWQRVEAGGRHLFLPRIFSAKRWSFDLTIRAGTVTGIVGKRVRERQPL